MEEDVMARSLSLFAIAVIALVALGCSPSTNTPPGGAGSPAASPGGASGSPTAKAYNVVLVSFDAGRAQEMSVYGYPKDTTPNLKKFADQAVVFDNAISAASWTLPSTMSIFTGLWPSVHGVLNKLTPTPDGKIVDTTLTDTIQTLPQLLKQNGYILGAFTGDAGVGGHFGYGRDFDVYLDDKKFGGFDHSIPAALSWIEKHKDQKFFVFLHGYDVHGQYDPPSGYKRTFVQDYKGKLKGGKDEQAVFREEALKNKFTIPKATDPILTEKEFTKEDGRFYQALYDEKLHDADARFAGFLAAMDKMGLTDKTIFVLLADHGEEFMEHGNLDHGPTLYTEMLHVPLIIKIPGLPPRRVEARVNSFDALPTVLDYLGIKTPHLDAVSLLPLMEGKEEKLPPVFSETDYRLYSHKRAAFVGDFEMIHSLDTDRYELYDLKSDPGEQHPLDPTKQPELKSTLDEWVRSLPQHYDYKHDANKTIKVY
jgi:arylsulfatase A-like enzyme